jgi:hypothetical protein
MVTRSNERAVANARAAATELSRLRVERTEVDLFLAELAAGRTALADQPA